jgi:hypothetical protein
VGILPLMVLNFWLIGWMADPPTEFGGDKYLAWARYTWVMAQLVFIATPWATMPLTLYLGDAMFLERTTAWRIAVAIWTLLPRMLICQGLLRGTLFAPLLMLMVEPYGMAPSGGEVLLMLLTTYVFLMRAFRPYLNEIILLERNPLRPTRANSLTIARRSSALHNPNAGDLLARWIGTAVLAVLMTAAFTYGFWFLGGTFTNDWNWGPVMLAVCVPLAMWLSAGLLCVTRFLSYLDLRIRREGWEVELRMRAEAARLVRHAA